MLRFFSEKATIKSMTDLASAEYLSVFVGAGASKEVGFPTWSELVARLSPKILGRAGKTPDSVSVMEYIQNSGPLAAAERIAGSMRDSELREAIRLAIYQSDDPGSLIPGPLVRAVAELKKSDPSRIRVVTTNYDQLLVQAARDAGLGSTKSFCTDTTIAESVVHLHGVIGFAPPADGKNEVVLTERHFLAPTSGGWRRDVVEKALASGPCLFLGVSLTDLNLLSPLHNSRSRYQHVVVFTRDEGLSPTATQAVERIERSRWSKLKVTSLFADNYVDSSVFVREVARLRSDRDSEPLVDRLREWHANVVTPFFPDDVGDYAAIQAQLSSNLESLLAEIQRSHDMELEVMQLGVFALGIDGSNEFAHVLATSDRVMKDPRSSEQLPLRRASNWTGVKTMCTAVPITEPKQNYASRWKHMLAVPVPLSELSGAPVGAVVLSSTAPDSALHHVAGTGLHTERDGALYGALQEAGQQVLRPA